MKVLAQVALVSLALVLAACTPGGEESPSPSPTVTVIPTTTSPEPTPEPTTEEPSPDPSPSLELTDDQQEAYDTVLEYFEARYQILADMEADLQPIVNVTTGEAQRTVLSVIQSFREQNQIIIGDSPVHVLDVGEVSERNDEPYISIRVCTSNADLDLIDVQTGESLRDTVDLVVLDWELGLVREHGSRWLVGETGNQRQEHECGT